MVYRWTAGRWLVCWYSALSLNIGFRFSMIEYSTCGCSGTWEAKLPMLRVLAPESFLMSLFWHVFGYSAFTKEHLPCLLSRDDCP